MPTLIEKHLAYVDNATVTAEKRQQKLWKAVTARRGKGGILPLTDPVLDEYIQAARMTASLMIDIEMVRDEYLAEKAGQRRKATRGKARLAGKGKAAPRRKAGKKR
ncbi:MAG: hypothetical protein JNK40_03910 [Chromatiales bacterium]|nr:hypothetical protein [Chromatiales bacterium]